jgi:hypothetical protein
MFLDLAVDQTGCDLPSKGFAPTTPHLSPVPKMGGERIKVEIEPVTRKERKAARGQALAQRVDEPMGHGLGAWAELKHRNNLGERINRQPQKDGSG